MINNYKNKKDSNRSNIWLTTDWHFGHKNIIKYESRPLNYQDQILNNLREKVSPDDIVINFGDVIFKQHSTITEMMNSLPGKYILVLGNHDRNKPQWYKNHGFYWVGKYYEYKNILFSHRPVDLSKWPNLKYNIHGHFHRKNRTDISRTKEFYPFYTKYHYLLSIEEMNYKPILLEDFMKLNQKN